MRTVPQAPGARTLCDSGVCCQIVPRSVRAEQHRLSCCASLSFSSRVAPCLRQALPVLRTSVSRGRKYCMAPKAFAGSDELAAYISEGPINSLAGISPESITKNIEEWKQLGAFVASNLKFGSIEELDDAQRERIFHLYLPVFFWIKGQQERHRSRQSDGKRTPLMLGMSAPQGCGKSTLVEQLEALFEHTGGKAAVFSLDDCYLTRSDQEALAAEYPENGLFQVRGNAGTHDLALGKKTLQELQNAAREGVEVSLPGYDKSAHAGKGDRKESAKWQVVKGPVDVVIFEGWMFGFRELPAHDAFKADQNLAEVNARLRHYVNALDTYMDSWLVLKVGDPQWVYAWREQAEQSRRAEGSGMSAKEVTDFVSRYIPAYQAYLPALYARGPTTAQPGRLLTISVDRDRSLAKQQPPKIK